jgi:hypothetical protein
MASKEGGERVEWIKQTKGDEGRETRCWIYWRRPEEWGQLIYDWVDETGQKGAVLTLYELVEGDASQAQGTVVPSNSSTNAKRSNYRLSWYTDGATFAKPSGSGEEREGGRLCRQ